MAVDNFTHSYPSTNSWRIILIYLN